MRYLNYLFKKDPSQPQLLESDVGFCLTFADAYCHANKYMEFFAQDVKARCSAECPLECNQLSYRITSSRSDYPSKVYYDFLVKDPSIARRFGLNAYLITYDNMKRSVLGLNIYYQTLNYILIEQDKKMTLFDLISNIGGLLGLFCEISFLSIVELIDLVTAVLLIWIK